MPEQHDPELVFVDVERDAGHATGELQQLLEADVRQALNLGDTGGDLGDRADFARSQAGREALPDVPHIVEYALEDLL